MLPIWFKEPGRVLAKAMYIMIIIKQVFHCRYSTYICLGIPLLPLGRLSKETQNNTVAGVELEQKMPQVRISSLEMLISYWFRFGYVYKP